MPDDPNKLPDPLAPSGLELDLSFKDPLPAPAAPPPPPPVSHSPLAPDPNAPSGLELDVSAPTRPPPRASPSPGPTGDRMAARSASRLEPVPEAPKELTRERIREGAIDTIFNSATILADVVDDFRARDRFFKYKAAVLATWLFLTVSAFMVACPGGGPTNDLGATLVVSGDASHPIYMVKNESLEVWQDVEVEVNGQYRSTLGQVEANGGSITLSAAVLFDQTGQKAPKTLRITDIVVRASEPEGQALLLKDGLPPK